MFYRAVNGNKYFKPVTSSSRMLSRRFRHENGAVPLASRKETQNYMFSADVFLANHVFLPKNGPVPSRLVNGYIRRPVTGHGFCEKMVLRQGVESVMKVAWRDGSRKTKFVG